jgi:hypothetical protein
MIVANGPRMMTEPTFRANGRERVPSRAIGAGTLARQASR